MALEIADPTKNQQLRDQMADLLQEMVTAMRQTQAIPTGFVCLVSFDNGDITNKFRCQPGFNALEMMGILRMAASDMELFVRSQRVR